MSQIILVLKLEKKGGEISNPFRIDSGSVNFLLWPGSGWFHNSPKSSNSVWIDSSQNRLDPLPKAREAHYFNWYNVIFFFKFFKNGFKKRRAVLEYFTTPGASSQATPMIKEFIDRPRFKKSYRREKIKCWAQF